MLVFYGIYQGVGVTHSALEGTAVLSVPLLVELLRVGNRTARATAASIGLITASAVLTHLSGGFIESHFHFFVMLAVIALYQNWLPFLVSVGYVLIHHGVMGAVASESVYNHPGAIANPWKWAVIHATFVSGACVAYVVAWRLNEDAQDAVRTSETRFRRLAEHSPVGIYQLAADQSELYLNPSALKMLEASNANEVLAWGIDHFMIDGSRETLATEREKRSRGLASSYEVDIKGLNGTFRTVLLSGTPLFAQDRTLHSVVGTITDITERKALEDALRHQAFHDSLTKLANRPLFTDRLEHALQRSQRTGQPVAVLFLDIDDFKVVNDRFGHSVGDLLLVEVARRLEQSIRPGDTAARFGGDEFAILAESVTSIADAQILADRILDSFAERFPWDQRELAVGASIGIAWVTGAHAFDCEAILRNADIAMYAAKAAGKGRSAIYEDAMHVSMIHRLDTLADIQHAVARNQLVLHYQPTLDLSSGQTVGVEALVRWAHPTRGLLPPSEFIPLAEESELIVEIGTWVLRTALADMKQWKSALDDNRKLTVSVNVSAKQLERASFADDVRAMLADACIAPADLVLEVTESLMLRDVETTVLRLQQLKSLGIRLAIDDFGTGYSSLSYLSQFPFDILKIDKSFVDGAGDRGSEQQLMPAIIDLGKMLNMQTIAEGVERPEQATRLKMLDCDLAQGFLFARPVPAAEIQAMLNLSLEAEAA